MKLFFKIKSLSFFLVYFLYLSLFFKESFAQDRNIVVLTYDSKGRSHADIAYKVLREKFKIPDRLIKKIQKNNPCVKIEDPIFHLCIDHNLELQIIDGRQDIVIAHFKKFQEF